MNEVNNNPQENKKDETVEKVLEIFKKGWNKQVILYGPPGTSKTYSAIEIAKSFLGEDKYKNNCKIIQFHPSYSYEDFVRGIVIKTAEGSATPTYEVERKIIETFAEDATEENKKVLIIDEINRAPLSSVLGELIYGLEYRGKAVYTPYVYKDKEGKEVPLKIPEHLYIIGTMNTADRSIGSIDYAVRRRFAFVPVLPNSGVIKGTWSNEKVGDKAETLFKALTESCFAENLLEDESIDVNDIKIGHTYFLGKGNEILEEKDELAYLKYRIEYQVKPIYEEYIKDGLIKKDGLEIFETVLGNPNKTDKETEQKS